MPEIDPERLHADLTEWGVLENGKPARFTRRFQAALARAAAELQAAEAAGEGTGGPPVGNQVETALAAFLRGEGKRAGPEHRAFVRALHVMSLPGAVRKLLGV
ncbi:MAG TPA: hypothetical protein VI818_08140 [Candidatus Thermoplasmatota archaeon]|nr:hypothetical protein [Candidatus Thermoplasmatota archaeon]